MDMMEVRRRVMLSMASEKLPEGVSVVEFEVTESSTLHTIRHGLSVIPKTIMIVPVIDIYDSGLKGNNNPFAITGFYAGSTGNVDYPYKLFGHNINQSTGNWDYTGSSMGWTADTQNIYLKVRSSEFLPIGNKYILFAKAY